MCPRAWSLLLLPALQLQTKDTLSVILLLKSGAAARDNLSLSFRLAWAVAGQLSLNHVRAPWITEKQLHPHCHSNAPVHKVKTQGPSHRAGTEMTTGSCPSSLTLLHSKIFH